MNLWFEPMPLSDPLFDFLEWLVKKIKRFTFEAYLMLRFMFYGVDDPREEEMIRRKEALRERNE